MSGEEPVLGNLEQTLCYPAKRLLWIYSKLRNSNNPVSLFPQIELQTVLDQFRIIEFG